MPPHRLGSAILYSMFGAPKSNPQVLPPENKTMELGGHKFRIDEPKILLTADIERGDRVIVTTASGNRYMLRRSERRNGALMISNERESKFENFYPVYDPGQAFAEIGKPMEFMAVIDEEKMIGQSQTSQSVTAIEIRRGLDKAIHSSVESVGGGEGIAETLRNVMNGRRR